MTRARSILAVAAVAAALSSSGCRDTIFTTAPRQLWDDMDWQNKFLPQQQNDFFADHRAMRPILDGTVAQGELRDDVAFYQGTDPATGKPLVVPPFPVTEAVLRRGQERFNIYCTPCHDKAGSGHGIVVQRGFHIPVDLAGDRVRGLTDGEIFQAISRGVRNMPAYGIQIPERDRWSIVTWVRVLGRSQHTVLADVPADRRAQVEPEGAK
jgi:mono/diheme cytochrome c family protein